MKAAFFEEHGGVEVLQVGDMPAPPLGPADVRIAVQATALNRLDLFVREGWPGLDLPLPHVGGTDLAGTVAAVGEDVEDWSEGDAVLVNPGLNFENGQDGRLVAPAKPDIVGETRWGGLADHCVVPASHLLDKPADLPWEHAAALPLTSLTAVQMLRKAGLTGVTQPNAGDSRDEPRKARLVDGPKAAEESRVLVVGGGGGVSVMAIQIAKALGAWVCATTGGADKVEKVQALGADEVIDYQADEAWGKSAFLATGKKGFDVVIDSVGAATWPHSVRALAAGGRLVTCGATTGGKVEMDVRNVFWKQLSILGSTMGTTQDLQEALDLVAAGKIKAVVDSVYALGDIREAHERLASGDVFGKVVVEP